MQIGEAIFLILILSALVIGVVGFAILFYIGKTRIKAIDIAVIGHEFPHDSIFALMLRVPNYAGGFMCKWCARRGHLEGKIEHFDSHFRRPFIAFMVITITEIALFIVSFILMKYLGLEPS